MPVLSIDAPDTIFNTTVKALCHRGQFKGTPEEELVFAKEMIITVLGDVTRDYVSYTIRNAAQSTIQKNIDDQFEQIAATRGLIQVEVN